MRTSFEPRRRWERKPGSALALLVSAACSNAPRTDVLTEGGDARARLQPDASRAPSICGAPGDLGNEIGVGKYCVTSDDCAENTAAVLCATIGNAATYFCTRPCDPAGRFDFCGRGAVCTCAELGCGCTPSECAERLAQDGGLPGADAQAVVDASAGLDASASPDAQAGGDGATTDVAPHPTPGECTPDPAGTGNSLNVGAYCTEGGMECRQYSFARLCSIDLDREGGNFCVHLICDTHDACGEEACCTGRPGNPVHACVPKGCVAPDAGVSCPPIP